MARIRHGIKNFNENLLEQVPSEPEKFVIDKLMSCTIHKTKLLIEVSWEGTLERTWESGKVLLEDAPKLTKSFLKKICAGALELF